MKVKKKELFFSELEGVEIKERYRFWIKKRGSEFYFYF